jgi:hypothetical protein
MEQYTGAVGGKLQLKGVTLSTRSEKLKKSSKKKKKKEKKAKKDKKSSSRKRGASAEGGSGGSAASLYVPTVVAGKGRLVTSGTTVHGQSTSFLHQLESGDAVEIVHPTTLSSERRLVTMVLSDVSMALSSAFSTDIVSSTSFSFIKKPPAEEDQEAARDAKRTKALADELGAFGTYTSKGGESFTYRTKKKGSFGSYHVVTEKLGAGESLSREELMDKRCSKKSDRFCY